MDVTGEVLLVLELVGEVTAAGIAVGGAKDGVSFRKDCTDLVRRISLLAHLLEEIREFRARPVDDAASAATSDDVDVESESWSSDLVVALRAAKRLLSLAGNFRSKSSSDGTTRRIASLFQSVTWKLEKALSSIPYDHFDISEEVQEQLLNEEIDQGQLGNRLIRSLHIQNNGSIDPEASLKMGAVPESNGSKSHGVNIISYKSKRLGNASDHSEACIVIDIDADGQDNSPNKSLDEIKKLDPIAIPDDFLCPISLELMRDPVIVATGQTYERSFIQRWIDSGNATCPKTQQKLENFTLTPNYALRSLIAQWCAKHNIEQPTGLTNGKIKKSDGSFRDVSGDIAAIRALVRKLSSRSVEEHRTAAAEIRSLSKRSTDNRILIAESGGIPILVNLLTSEDVLTQENAVTSILNLSIYENNKGLIMLAGAIPSIVQVLRNGSMEARENAAATLFSLSLGDENKIIIGASGAIPALVVLLQDGSTRGKKDAATALFNLCIYQGNKGRAVRAGIISALLKMLTDPSNCMVDEALTIMSVLASHHEAKVAIVKASTIPVLIDLLRTGLPRNKENAAAILLALCKRDSDNLACISRLGAVIPLTELAKSGTERAKRKATSLLEHLRKLQQL
ncbi:u-box domain-containing protein 10 [Quercus suber]|uniref:RING-type E3 ubiquitin transferase n=1 Tax=Quercus suber TaxID=58331 RepID=A0AAW0L185_QUESU